jgi:8-oxo-dGTP diphosphatase
MLGFFTNHQPAKLQRINNSIMACGKSDEHWWYFACSDRSDFISFLKNLSNGDHCLAVINDWMLDEVKKRFIIKQILSCYRLYLPQNVMLPEVNLPVEILNVNDAEEIFSNSNYKDYTSVEYIKDQIISRSGVCIRINGKLAGWALFHDDGAMGMLHVVNEFRRKGIAKALVINLCKGLREKNEVPFTSVEPSNIASLTLIQSLGFENIGLIHWVKMNLKNVDKLI